MLLLFLPLLHFGVTWSFVRLSLNPHKMIKRIVICRVRRLAFWGDVVAEIFSLPRLGFPADVAWRSVFLPGVGTSRSTSSRHLMKASALMWTDMGRWMEAERNHRYWPPQTPWYILGVCFSFIGILICLQIDTQTLWNLRIDVSVMKQHRMLLPNLWRWELCHRCCFPHRQVPNWH